MSMSIRIILVMMVIGIFDITDTGDNLAILAC